MITPTRAPSGRPLNPEMLSDVTQLLPITGTRKPRRFRRIVIALLCWGYLLLILGLIVVIRVKGDHNWWATLLIFAPRWGVLLPLPILIPLALWGNRRMVKVLVVAVIAAIFPLMGFCVGWHRFTADAGGGLPIRIVAFNVHHHNLKDPAAARFFAGVHPDVVSLEELPPDFNIGLFPNDTWQIRWDGEMGIASRFPIVDVRPVMYGPATRFRLKTPAGLVDFIVVHLNSPHYALKDTIIGSPQGRRDLMVNINERALESQRLREIIARHREPLIIAGDFNLAFDSLLLRSNFSALVDSFEASGFGFGWTYRNGWTAVRIDHVMSDTCFDRLDCYTGPFLGSPHRPVVADLVLKTRP